MYTNTNTDYALQTIAEYLSLDKTKQQSKYYDSVTLINILWLVMHNSIIKAGDFYTEMILVTAMETLPAPPCATLFKGLHKSKVIMEYKPYLLLYKQWIDDVIRFEAHQLELQRRTRTEPGSSSKPPPITMDSPGSSTSKYMQWTSWIYQLKVVIII